MNTQAASGAVPWPARAGRLVRCVRPARPAARAGMALVAMAALAALGGCAGPSGPAAWDKSFIAKPEMSMGWGRHATKFDQHVYESKEGASGGYGVGGGGCGCN